MVVVMELTAEQERDLQHEASLLRAKGRTDEQIARFERKCREGLTEEKLSKRPASLSVVIDVLAKILKPIVARMDALEQQSKNFRYLGVYEPGRTYGPGNFVTHAGSVWHANETTVAKPGTDGSWTLAVKRGRGDRR